MNAELDIPFEGIGAWVLLRIHSDSILHLVGNLREQERGHESVDEGLILDVRESLNEDELGRIDRYNRLILACYRAQDDREVAVEE